ncbi:hypothetical protein DN730_09740 [Marinomonas piezotolerans]|uniref:HTH luxR-type domain-containing protein n=1 Tax=Marinomonas piezotolerans TaxID=2213058 RepID=A0A370UA48_9GAMM|nr:LuxR C-terminal-related transcriptional regulator [Marinomonas piezotolerans]RDL44657.1 hypothetical protein DN730_09740 [Marinomonas piezotolerans]
MQDAKQISFYPSSHTSELSAHALEILAMTAQGLRSKQIANTVCRSVPTIHFHQDKARKHYDASNLTEAVAKAIALGDILFCVEPVQIKTAYRRATAIAMVLAAMTTTALDTPFTFDADLDLARHHTTRAARTVKVRGNRRELTDFIIG